jgi:hypothetical protein
MESEPFRSMERKMGNEKKPEREEKKGQILDTGKTAGIPGTSQVWAITVAR